jgi:hypothetical protein
MSPPSTLNPRTTSYEFFGPIGALFITIVVPLTTYLLYFGCSEQSGGCPPDLSQISFDVSVLKTREFWLSLWDTQATIIYLAWYAFCVVAWFILPGDLVDGVKMRNGLTKKYKINGTYGATLIYLDLTMHSFSISYFSPRLGYYCWCHNPLWSPIVHFFLH